MATVTSIERKIEIWKRKTIFTDDGHWLFTGAQNKDGYGQVRLGFEMLGIHRVSAHLFLGLDLNSRKLALHKNSCPHKNCWNPECIYIGTVKDNVRDTVKSGHHKGWAINTCRTRTSI